MNFPEVIEYSVENDKFRAELEYVDDYYDAIYLVYLQGGSELSWLSYCYNSYKNIQEIINKEKQMNVTALKQQLEAAQNEITKLQQAIEKAEAENDVWPKDGDEYYLIGSCGEINSYPFSSKNSVDTMRLVIGNCYKTKEEAEQVVEKMKVMAELKRIADKSWKEAGIEIDWSNDNTPKYYVRDSPNESYLFIDNNYSIKNINDFYFHSEEKAKEAIDKIGEERLKSVFKQN